MKLNRLCTSLHGNWLRSCSLPLALVLGGCAAVGPGGGSSGGVYPPRSTEATTIPVKQTPTAPAPSAPPAVPVALAPEAPPVPIDPLRPERKVDLEDRSARIDLWARLRRGFAMPDLDTELVRDREQWYASRPDYVQRMTERGSRYLFHILEEVEKRGMPTELALLPFIESAFNPQAMSTASASGMWQFIPSTGKHFDLTQNIFRDDRRDVLASTRAALDYLQKLHAMFGDWRLALAAYNWGEGSVQRAMARNERDGLPTDYLSLRMPQETQHYLPKLQAVKNIVARPQQFGLALPALENHPYFLAIPIDRDIDVDLAAKLAGMSLADFKTLNPQMNKPVILAAGTQQILLPYDNANEFVRRHGSHKGAMASWTAWVAPKTMHPRVAAQEHGMNETALRELNRIPPRMLIKAGSTLLVPRSAQRSADVSEHLADHAVMSLAPDVPPLRRVSLRAGKRDSVAAIAKRYRVSESQVAQWNKTSTGARFSRGQTIIVYVPVQSSSRVAAGATSKKGKLATSNGKSGGSHGSARVAGKSKPASSRTAHTRSGKGSRVAESGKSPISQIKY